ncbi:MAG TPA: response regulator [Pyrinomonadaceae bacterium]|nr:response regulator [Pyrinomonadaceae bacterium]
MHEPTADSQPTDDGGRAPRLALLVAEGEATEGLRARLAEAGFGVALAGPGEASRAVAELSPAFVVIAFGEREGEARLVSLARRLRADPASFALPVVFLFREDSRTLRSAASHFGADDYFSQEAGAAELRARLDALLWRAEAGRRAAPLVAEQRSEIDNFIFLLDAVGADAAAGEHGALALVEAADGAGGDERALAAAHGFLKLNLRRVDAVAFYGPTTLLVYLARAGGAAARDLLAGLREEFLSERARTDLRAGLASFPGDGVEVEKLIEKAESALAGARGPNPPARVLVYGEADDAAAARPERETTGAAARDAGRRAASRESATATKAAARGEGGAGEAPPPEAARQGEARSRRAKLRRMMLIVSDAERMAQVNLLLRSTASYEVRAAFDGQHALNLLRIDRPDLLLVDYELQGMDGAEMLRRLRKQSGRRSPPPAVVLLPGGREDLRREVLEAGARAAVGLPYDAVELLDALERVGDTE